MKKNKIVRSVTYVDISTCELKSVSTKDADVIDIELFPDYFMVRYTNGDIQQFVGLRYVATTSGITMKDQFGNTVRGE